jgi:hypothetical protein
MRRLRCSIALQRLSERVLPIYEIAGRIEPQDR